jgi:hypothetical protein
MSGFPRFPAIFGTGADRVVARPYKSVKRRRRQRRSRTLIRLWAILAIAAATENLAAQTHVTYCQDCHDDQATQLAASVHMTLNCRECHGGPAVYELTAELWTHFGARAAVKHRADAQPSVRFDHGESFRGSAARADVLARCGTCPSDWSASTRTGSARTGWPRIGSAATESRSRETGDDRVAVRIDCHGSHDVLRKDKPHSRTHFRHLPETCGRCGADPALMTPYDRSPDIVEQYRNSVHGRDVLEYSDAGSPNCATCHGSHAAAAPGFADVRNI